MRKILFLIWSWGTTFAFAGLIYWIATIPQFQTATGSTDELIKLVYRLLLYAIFFLLLFRAIMATLRSSIARLSKWHSKREAEEDAEFVLIIETLVVTITSLAVMLFAIFEEYIQNFVAGRNPELKDVLVSIMATLLTGLIVYSMPIIGELEVALNQKLKQELRWLKEKRGKKKQSNPEKTKDAEAEKES